MAKSQFRQLIIARPPVAGLVTRADSLQDIASGVLIQRSVGVRVVVWVRSQIHRRDAQLKRWEGRVAYQIACHSVTSSHPIKRACMS